MNTNGNYFNKDSDIRKLLTKIGEQQATYPPRLLSERRKTYLVQVNQAIVKAGKS